METENLTQYTRPQVAFSNPSRTVKAAPQAFKNQPEANSLRQLSHFHSRF